MYYGKRTSLVPTYDTLVLHDLISLLLQMAKEEVQIQSVKIMIEKYECELTRKFGQLVLVLLWSSNLRRRRTNRVEKLSSIFHPPLHNIQISFGALNPREEHVQILIVEHSQVLPLPPAPA